MGAVRNVYLALCLTARTVIGRKATKYGDRSLQSGQAMYVESNIEALSCNHCCSGKTISITDCECVFVALGIQHAMSM